MLKSNTYDQEEEKMDYTFPEEVTMESAFMLQSELSQLAANGDEKIILNFPDYCLLRPAGMLMYGSIIRRFNEDDRYPSVEFAPVKDASSPLKYAETCGFPTYAVPGQETSRDRGSGGATYTPIEEINIDKELPEKVKNDVAENLMNVLFHDQANERELKKLFGYLIEEIVQNVYYHAYDENDPVKLLWVCGQYWPNLQEAEIAILDEGQGIFNSLCKNEVFKNLDYIIRDNYDALKWAVFPRFSQTLSLAYGDPSDIGAPVGAGLFSTSKFCQKLGGEFCMVSGGNYNIIEPGKEPKIDKASFQGTAIQIRINPFKLEDFDSLQSEISEERADLDRDIKEICQNSKDPRKELNETVTYMPKNVNK